MRSLKGRTAPVLASTLPTPPPLRLVFIFFVFVNDEALPDLAFLVGVLVGLFGTVIGRVGHNIIPFSFLLMNRAIHRVILVWLCCRRHWVCRRRRHGWS
jgi:hypothetical protein